MDSESFAFYADTLEGREAEVRNLKKHNGELLARDDMEKERREELIARNNARIAELTKKTEGNN